MPDDPEAEQRKCSAGAEDPGVLLPACQHRTSANALVLEAHHPPKRLIRGINSRSPLDPTNSLPAQPQRVCRVQQSPLRPLQHAPLLHQILQDRPPLRDILIYRVLALLQKCMFAQGEVFSCGWAVICRLVWREWRLMYWRSGCVPASRRRRGGVWLSGRGRGGEKLIACLLFSSRPAARL